MRLLRVGSDALLEKELAAWQPEATDAPTVAGGPLVEVPTVYDGPDLDEVARHWRLTTREVVDLHTSTEMVVAFCGFAPGFAYCTGPQLPLPVPRLSEPRTRVPTGSVGLADLLGVPRSGALDAEAACYANRLVGNREDAAVLETTLGGVIVRVDGPTAVAVTGAPAAVVVDGRPAPFAEPVHLRPGQTLSVGHAASGLRSYLGFWGGLDVEPVLGSRSTDTLSGLGPPRLVAGMTLPLGERIGDPHGVDVPVVLRHPDTVRLRLVPGPRHDWFADDVLERLGAAEYAVSVHSNRVGVRLEGQTLPRRRHGELPSEGLVLGAVQVPASGQPLVFLNDHPTTGGYPVVGVVAPDDLAACAQLRPGASVRFVL